VFKRVPEFFLKIHIKLRLLFILRMIFCSIYIEDINYFPPWRFIALKSRFRLL